MINVVKCWKEFFGNFNTYSRNSQFKRCYLRLFRRTMILLPRALILLYSKANSCYKVGIKYCISHPCGFKDCSTKQRPDQYTYQVSVYLPSISILIIILSILIFKYWYRYFLFQKRTEILIIQYYFYCQYQYFLFFYWSGNYVWS